MNKKYINITLFSLLFCTVHNSNGQEINLGNSSQEFDQVEHNIRDDLAKFKNENNRLSHAVLLKIISSTVKKTVKKSDSKGLTLALEIADEVAAINIGSKWINGSSFGAEKISGKLKYGGDASDKKTLIASLFVVIGGRLLDKTPLSVVGKKYDEFFKSFLDGRLESAGDLLKKGVKSLCVNGTLLIADSTDNYFNSKLKR